MAKQLEAIVEGAVAQVLEQHLGRVQAENVPSLLAELPIPAAPVDAGTTSPMPGGLVGAAAAQVADAFAGLSPDSAETHRKALRFARLLVEEIKLYNQAKVNARPPNCTVA